LALTAQERPITTVEGLSQGGQLHLMQQAFIDQDAFQCGYCTPGQIVSAIACVKEGHAANDDDIREYMSGNICRCAAYPNIVAAVKQAAAAGVSLRVLVDVSLRSPEVAVAIAPVDGPRRDCPRNRGQQRLWGTPKASWTGRSLEDNLTAMQRDSAGRRVMRIPIAILSDAPLASGA
jgi:hypothetical protein